MYGYQWTNKRYIPPCAECQSNQGIRPVLERSWTTLDSTLSGNIQRQTPTLVGRRDRRYVLNGRVVEAVGKDSTQSHSLM